MKNIKIRYRLLLSGFPGVSNDYSYKDYKVKREYIDNQEMNNILKKKEFDLRRYLLNCILIDNENNYYLNYLENEIFYNFLVSEKCELKVEKLTNLINKYPSIVTKIDDLITEMRLTLNIPLSIPIKIIEVFSDKEEYIGYLISGNETCFWDRLSYIDINEFINNTRFTIDFNFYSAIANNRYKRALLFYNNSFESNVIETRYTMLISCLESLFNYQLTKEESITKRVSSTCANILSIFDQNYENYYQKIKSYYNKRSRYLHGDNNTINLEDEKELRKITRKVLLFCAYELQSKNYTIKELIKFLNKREEYSLQDKLYLKSLFSTSFQEQQISLIELIEKETNKKIPKEVVDNLLSKVSIK